MGRTMQPRSSTLRDRYVIPVLDYRLVAETILQDEYSILNSKHFIGIHGYIIVYSVTSRQSFDMVRVIRDKILNHLVSYRPSQN
jgi:predicted Abi (CAAX) family protease